MALRHISKVLADAKLTAGDLAARATKSRNELTAAQPEWEEAEPPRRSVQEEDTRAKGKGRSTVAPAVPDQSGTTRTRMTRGKFGVRLKIICGGRRGPHTHAARGFASPGSRLLLHVIEGGHATTRASTKYPMVGSL